MKVTGGAVGWLVVVVALAGGLGAQAQYTEADYNCTATMTYVQARTGAVEGPPPGRPDANFTVALAEYEAAFSDISATAPWTMSWNWTIAGNSTLDAATLSGAGVADNSTTAQDINFSGTGSTVSFAGTSVYGPVALSAQNDLKLNGLPCVGIGRPTLELCPIELGGDLRVSACRLSVAYCCTAALTN